MQYNLPHYVALYKVRLVFVPDTSGGLKGTAVQASSAQSKVSFNEVWCNGSTTDFGSVCSGSSPLTSTNANIANNIVIVSFKCNTHGLNDVDFVNSLASDSQAIFVYEYLVSGCRSKKKVQDILHEVLHQIKLIIIFQFSLQLFQFHKLNNLSANIFEAVRIKGKWQIRYFSYPLSVNSTHS